MLSKAADTNFYWLMYLAVQIQAEGRLSDHYIFFISE